MIVMNSIDSSIHFTGDKETNIYILFFSVPIRCGNNGFHGVLEHLSC